MRRVLPLLLVAVVLVGCGGSSPGAGPVTVTEQVTVFTTPGTTVAVPSAGPLARDGFAPIAAGLRRLLGRDPLLLEAGLYESYAFFRVYDRATGFADDYEWRDGAFGPPTPYKVGSTDLERTVFALEEIAPDGPFRFIDAISRIPLEGAGDDSPSIIVMRDFVGGDEIGPVVFRSSLDGTRQYLSITGNSRGAITERRLS